MNDPLTDHQSKTLWTKILNEAESIPALPDIINKVLEQIDDPNSNPKKFQEIISKDPVLSAKVLKMSNSAYYGFSREIDTLTEAVIILGLETLKSLVIAASAYKSLNKDFKGYGLNKGDLWKHSLATAMAARLLAKSLNFPETEKFFVSGLLHDIGKILLNKFIKDFIPHIKTLVKMREISFNEAEKQILKFNHCDVGAELSKYWKLPELFYSVSLHHHTPFEALTDSAIYVKIVHVADIIAYKSKLGLGVDGNFYKLDGRIYEEFKIDQKLIKDVSRKVHTSIREFERVFI